mmetsp:Transcript_42119/g.120462  ORF Transcript_42119/g.120462 Transcript_42119/m.120462 type:complete len:260 (+) Transcript_42119:204-983(+)
MRRRSLGRGKTVCGRRSRQTHPVQVYGCSRRRRHARWERVVRQLVAFEPRCDRVFAVLYPDRDVAIPDILGAGRPLRSSLVAWPHRGVHCGAEKLGPGHLRHSARGEEECHRREVCVEDRALAPWPEGLRHHGRGDRALRRVRPPVRRQTPRVFSRPETLPPPHGALHWRKLDRLSQDPCGESPAHRADLLRWCGHQDGHKVRLPDARRAHLPAPPRLCPQGHQARQLLAHSGLRLDAVQDSDGPQARGLRLGLPTSEG